MPLATFELVQSLKNDTHAIDRRLAKTEGSADVADSVQSNIAHEVKALQASVARLSQRMADMQHLLLAGFTPDQEQDILEDVSEQLERHSLRLHKIDDRMYVR
jgi:hypothetical protein